MRLMTWNCRVGAFRRKAARVAGFRPDVLVVPEVEHIDGEMFLDGDPQPTFRQRCGGSDAPRGLGVFGYTDTRLQPAFDDSTALWGFWPFTAECAGSKFQVVGVWTYKVKGHPATSYRQAHQGLERYRSWIRQAPTVLIGDFNTSGGRPWKELIELTDSFGLVSAYHAFFKEEPGTESRPTHFHRGGSASTSHVDYCFIPRDWAEKELRVQVGEHHDWQEVSDHVPLIVDVDI